jgi:hypothetical protein
MKPELDRVKNDLETMQKAIGLTSPPGRDWIHWLNRDKWLNFWWAVPGLMLIAASLAPLDDTRKFLGLIASQWVGLAVAGVLLGMLFFWGKMMRSDARPPAVVREYKRINSQASLFLVGFIAQIALYFAWGVQHSIAGGPFTAGLWIMCGSAMLLLATVTKGWVYLAWAFPMIAFGLCQPLLEGRGQGGLWLGVVFIVAAFLSWSIQGVQSRMIEKQHGAH